jgi:DNA-binding transcriptional LysR family regulator
MVRAKGTLRFGVHPAFRTALMRKLGGFLAAHPDIKIEAVVTNSPAALLDDGLDVVFTIGELADSAFVARRLGWTALLTCAAPSYLEACGRPHHPADLTRYGAVIPGRRDEDSFAHWEFVRGVEHVDVDVPVVFVALDGIGIVDVAAAGIGVAKIYDLSATPLIQAGDLEIVLPDWGPNGSHSMPSCRASGTFPRRFASLWSLFSPSFARRRCPFNQSLEGRPIQVIP